MHDYIIEHAPCCSGSSKYKSPHSLDDGAGSILMRKRSNKHQVIDKEATHVLGSDVESFDEAHIAKNHGLGATKKIGREIARACVHVFPRRLIALAVGVNAIN